MSLPKAGQFAIPDAPMPRRRMGHTGQMISILGLGGYHLGAPPEAEAVRIVEMAVDHGLDFLDNCWDYNAGRSEEIMGKALAGGGRRAKAFLMSKIDARTGAAARGQLEQSLRRLRTEMIDLVQIHEVMRADDPERAFAADGAIAALLQARRAGKLRFIGFTGHKDPQSLNHMLDVAAANGFRFDTVQLPLNVMDPHYQSFETHTLPRLLAEDIGVLAMKPLGAGPIIDSGAITAEEGLRYSLSLPVATVVTGCDTIGVLEQALAIGKTFTPMTEAERRALVERTRPHGETGRLEPYKNTGKHDGTVANPHWMDEARL